MSDPPAAAARPAARPPPTARLFVALWPGDGVRAAIAACRDRIAWPPSARPVANAKLHLTLHFIGSLPTDRIAALVDALDVAGAGFELHLDRVEHWPGGLTVLCPRRAPAALLRLHAGLADALRESALPVEARRHRPHVTLARRDGPREPAMLDAPIRWPVDGHALVQSAPDGSYRVLRRYRAAAAGAHPAPPARKV